MEIIKELPEDTCPDFCMEGELVESFEAAISMPTETMTQRVELTIGNAALEITDEEIGNLFRKMITVCK